MRHSWIASPVYALAANGLLIGSLFAADGRDYYQGAQGQSGNIEQRVADLEAELARTRQTLHSQQAELDRHNGQLMHLPPVDNKTPAIAASVATALADPATGEAKLSEGYEVGSDLNMNVRWNNGILFETKEKDFTMHVGGRFHYDWVAFDPNAGLNALPAAGGVGPWEDGAFIRRARFQMDGRMWSVIDYNLELDFAGFDQTAMSDTINNTAATREVVLQDVWVQAGELPVVGHFRIGHLKQPMGLENYNSSKFLTFMERGALHDAFLQEYDPGFLFWDNAFMEQVWWGTGFYRIDPEETGIDFGDGEYAWTSRICGLLWDQPDHRYLMHVGGSYSHRNSEFDPATGAEVVRYRARPEVRATPRLVDTGTLATDNADLVGAEAAWVSGPLSVQGEYLWTHIDNASIPAGAALGDLDFHGYYVFASYFLTGEHRPYDTTVGAFGRVKPNENFWLVHTCDGPCMGLGAWEAAVRYSNVDLADGGVNGGNMDQITAGLNWYWNPNVRMMFNYIWADRDIFAPQQSGDVQILAMRASLDF